MKGTTEMQLFYEDFLLHCSALLNTRKLSVSDNDDFYTEETKY